MRRLLAAAVAMSAAALLPAPASAHDGGIVIGDGHAQLVNFGVGPFQVGALPATNVEHVTGDNGFTGGHVVIQGDRLYLGSYGRGLHIYDISEPRSPVRIGDYVPGGPRADAPPDAIDVGERRFAVLNGTRRTHTNDALIGPGQDLRTDRTEWLDTTDAANPVLLDEVGPSQSDGESHNGDIVDSRRLYVASGGSGIHGLRLYDLTPTVTTPAEQCRPKEEPNPCAPIKLFGSQEGQDPTTLWESSPYRSADEPVGAPFTHTHDVEVYTDYKVRGLGRRDIMMLAEGGNYTAGNDAGSMFVIDITDPTDPVVLYRWLHEKGPDHHPIRYHHEVQFLDSDPRIALVTDEDLHNGCGGAGGIVALRLAPDLQSAQELSEWFIPAGTPAPVCSVHVFSSQQGLVALGSYNAGLQIVDYNDPANPQQVGEYIAEGATSWGALFHEDVIYVGDMSRGLDVFEYTGPRPGGRKGGGPKKGGGPRR